MAASSIKQLPKDDATAILEICEQPKKFGFRFHHTINSEGNAILPKLHGVNSNLTNNTCVTVKLKDCKQAKLVVSCVTCNAPYFPHPHNLIGKHCRSGVFCTKFCERAILEDVHLQCILKEGAQNSLEIRRKIQVDPFKTGYDVSQVDFSAFRLCFQAFLIRDSKLIPLEPVVSEPILDAGQHQIEDVMKTDVVDKREQPKILKVSRRCGLDCGGNEVMIFCTALESGAAVVIEFVNKQNQVYCRVPVEARKIHRQVGLSFTTPPYSGGRLTEARTVKYRLRCGSQMSDLESFVYQPSSTDPPIKRSKIGGTSAECTPQSLPLALLSSSEKGSPFSELSTESSSPERKITEISSPSDTTSNIDLSPNNISAL